MTYDPNNRANFDNTNSGALFPNDRKQNEKSPNVKGEAHICCPHCGAVQKFWVSAWTKVSKGGKKFMSLAFNADTTTAPAPKSAPSLDEEFDDDIPF